MRNPIVAEPRALSALAERVLRWAVIEHGTAGLADRDAACVVAPFAPTWVLPPEAAIAGPVVLFERRRAEGAASGASFGVLRRSVTPGSVVLVRCDRSVGAAFGSNLALEASLGRAQAILTDGACRDSRLLASTGLVVGATATDPTRPRDHPIASVDEVDLFGLGWRTGDWLLRDRDGVVRLAADVVPAVVEGLRATDDGELAALLGPA
jgi:regulator of RNase E activity RraA